MQQAALNRVLMAAVAVSLCLNGFMAWDRWRQPRPSDLQFDWDRRALVIDSEFERLNNRLQALETASGADAVIAPRVVSDDVGGIRDELVNLDRRLDQVCMLSDGQLCP